eukprot:1675618-Prymnesium_polylepis.1
MTYPVMMETDDVGCGHGCGALLRDARARSVSPTKRAETLCAGHRRAWRTSGRASGGAPNRQQCWCSTRFVTKRPSLFRLAGDPPGGGVKQSCEGHSMHRRPARPSLARVQRTPFSANRKAWPLEASGALAR